MDFPLSLRGDQKEDEKMTIDKELLTILVCPKCKGKLSLNESHDGLICSPCKLLYPIKEGIPVMLIEEASPLKTP